jgi:16S rRNA (guanine966-N2)-methyltransferase
VRIIAGTFSGRKLKLVPATDTTRHTLDRVKVVLFDTLGNDVLEEARVLDAFCGSGSLGLEALSRGSKSCTFLDHDKLAISTAKHNVALLGVEANTIVRCTDSLAFLKRYNRSFDIVILDPPQKDLVNGINKNKSFIWMHALFLINSNPLILNANSKVIVKIDPKDFSDDAELSFSYLALESKKKIGNSLLLFYQAKFSS